MAKLYKRDYILTNCLIINKKHNKVVENDLIDVIPHRYNIYTKVEGIESSDKSTYQKNSFGFDKYFDKISLK